MLYADIPTPSDIVALATFRGEGCVTIYLRTTPVTPRAQADRIKLKNLARRAAERPQAAGTDKQSCAAIAEQVDDLVDDNEFWRFQAHSLAIFATPPEPADVSRAQCASAARDRLRPISCEAAAAERQLPPIWLRPRLGAKSVQVVEVSPICRRQQSMSKACPKMRVEPSRA